MFIFLANVSSKLTHFLLLSMFQTYFFQPNQNILYQLQNLASLCQLHSTMILRHVAILHGAISSTSSRGAILGNKDHAMDDGTILFFSNDNHGVDDQNLRDLHG